MMRRGHISLADDLAAARMAIAAKDAEIAALKGEVVKQKALAEKWALHESAGVETEIALGNEIEGLKCELDVLRAKLSAMGKPVTDEEWAGNTGGPPYSLLAAVHGDVYAINLFLASRASQPNPPEEQP